MDVDPMDPLHQRNRKGLEIGRYPFLATEIIRRKPEFCQHMSDLWQESVLVPMNERMIPARVHRPHAFTSFGHWGPFAHTNNWGTLVAAV